MTSAQCLQYLVATARQSGLSLSKTAQMRLLYLADLRAVRHGCKTTTGIAWERADHGPFSRSVQYLAKNVELPEAEDCWQAHARAVLEAYARTSHEDLGTLCKGSAPMRKAASRGDLLDLEATSPNDLTASVTAPTPSA